MLNAVRACLEKCRGRPLENSHVYVDDEMREHALQRYATAIHLAASSRTQRDDRDRALATKFVRQSMDSLIRTAAEGAGLQTFSHRIELCTKDDWTWMLHTQKEYIKAAFHPFTVEFQRGVVIVTWPVVLAA